MPGAGIGMLTMNWADRTCSLLQKNYEPLGVLVSGSQGSRLSLMVVSETRGYLTGVLIQRESSYLGGFI